MQYQYQSCPNYAIIYYDLYISAKYHINLEKTSSTYSNLAS